MSFLYHSKPPQRPFRLEDLPPGMRILLGRLEQMEAHFIYRLSKMEHMMGLNTDKLNTDITALTSVVQGAATAFTALEQTNADQAKQIQTLKDALAAAQSTSDPAVQQAIDAMDQNVLQTTALLQGALPAITANTGSTAADTTAAAATVAAAQT